MVGFLDEDPANHGSARSGVPILGPSAWLDANADDVEVFVAIGDNSARTRIADSLRTRRIPLASAVHPSAVVMDGVRVDRGSFVGPGAVLVTGTRVADDVIVNTGATVDHDGALMRGSHLAPGVHAAGRVTVGSESLVGVGATLSAGVTVGRSSVVGAGSLVLEDVPERVIVAGVPARTLRTLDGPVDWARMLRPGRSMRVTPG